MSEYKKINFKGTAWESMNWIYLNEDGDQWQAAINCGNEAFSFYKSLLIFLVYEWLLVSQERDCSLELFANLLCTRKLCIHHFNIYKLNLKV